AGRRRARGAYAAVGAGPIPIPHPPGDSDEGRCGRRACLCRLCDKRQAARRRRRVSRKRLAIYLMCGRAAPELARAAVAGGADLIELGFPFSDPLADGPVIRAAAERALAEGMHTRECLDCLAQARAGVDVPLVPMTYASLLDAYGYERFAADAAAAGATSLIVADLPIEAEPGLARV